MKKHLSVFGLIARHSFYKILLLLLAMCGIELFVFQRRLSAARELYEVLGSFPRPESLITSSGVGMGFMIAFVLIFLLLCLTAGGYNTRTGYTVSRLLINERHFYFWGVLYYAAMLLALWAAQALTVFFMSMLYEQAAPSALVSAQTVMLGFYRSELLHAILPLEDVGLWVRNLLVLFSLSLTAASFSYLNRRGRFGTSALAAALYAIATFKSEIGDGFYLFSSVLIFVVISFETVYHLWSGGKSDETEEV